MLLKLFNSNRIGIFVLIVLLPVIFWLPDLFTGVRLHGPINSGTLPGSWIQYLNENNKILARFIALIFILANAYLLVLLNRIHIFIPERTQLPALFYIILVACFSPVHYLSSALVASTLMILVLYRMIMTYKANGISYSYLDAGFLISLSSLIYFPSILFFLLLSAGLSLLRPFNWREWVYAIIGLILPYVFLFSGYFLAGVQVTEYFRGFSALFARNRQVFSLIQVINWVYIFAMLLYGSYFMVATIDNMKIQGRKIFMLFLWLFLISVGIYLIVPGAGMEMICFAAVPVAFLFSHYFYKCQKNWINEILFSIFLLMMLLLRIL